MATVLLSVPAAYQTPISQRPFSISVAWLHGSAPCVRNSYKHVTLVCSSSSSSISVIEDYPSPPPPIESDSAAEEVDEVPFSGCKACGRQEVEKGCNGEGRIQGGIATVPGFGWWPIKAYRPCPGFVASGGRYRRRGQSMDEVAAGRKGREPPLSTTGGAEAQLRKKPTPTKFER